MSENAQKVSQQADKSSNARIRAGALLIPLRYVSARAGRERRKLRRELGALRIPGQAETFMPAAAYLEGLARLDRFQDVQATVFQAALTQDLAEVGLLGKAMVHAENLWSALEYLREGIEFLQPGSRIHMRIHGGRCRITYFHPFGRGAAQDLDVQLTMGLLCNLLSECVNPATHMLELSFPGAAAVHKDLLDGQARVSQSDIGALEFNDELLRQPLRRSLPNMADVVFFAFSQTTSESDEAVFSKVVRSLQEASIAHLRRPLRKAEVSWLLDIPGRTLQHNLKGEGARFDQVRDKARHKAARYALLVGKEIKDIAEDVGFAHRQSFSEAFSAWEGCSPSEFRARAHNREE